MTNQEAFDKACEHLAQQKRQSITGANGLCKYRTHDGLKCAVGALIPDDEYIPMMDTHGGIKSIVATDIKDQKELVVDYNRFVFGKDTPSRCSLVGVSVNLLNELQTAHDYAVKSGAKQAEALRNYLINIGTQYELNCKKAMLIQEWNQQD